MQKVNYLSLYFIHQIGIILSSCEYEWLTLAQTTLIGSLHPSSLFILQLPVYCWISLFIMRHCEHWAPPPFLCLYGKQWHRTSLCRDFWPLAEHCLRQLGIDMHVDIDLLKCHTVLQLQLWAKVFSIENYIVQLNSVCVLDMLHEGTGL